MYNLQCSLTYEEIQLLSNALAHAPIRGAEASVMTSLINKIDNGIKEEKENA